MPATLKRIKGCVWRLSVNVWLTHLPPPHNFPLGVHLEGYPVITSSIRTGPVSLGVTSKYVGPIGAD